MLCGGSLVRIFEILFVVEYQLNLDTLWRLYKDLVNAELRLRLFVLGRAAGIKVCLHA